MRVMKIKSFKTKIFLVILLATVSFFAANSSVSAIGLLRPFGGKVLSITPNLDVLCPSGASIVVVGLPTPIIAAFTNVPGLVINGPTGTGNWVLGFATPPVPPCLPTVFLMGTSRSGGLPF